MEIVRQNEMKLFRKYFEKSSENAYEYCVQFSFISSNEEKPYPIVNFLPHHITLKSYIYSVFYFAQTFTNTEHFSDTLINPMWLCGFVY